MGAVAKVSVAMQKQILELHAQGMTARKIAKVLKVGRNTIRKIINRNSVSEPGASMPSWAKTIDWEKVRLEVARGVPVNILAREHASEVISYVQFWRQFHKKYPLVPKVTMRLDHRPGEKCFFDYAEGIDIVNASTGEVQTTSICCGVMAMSSYTFGEFTMTERRSDLIRSMENAFRYFGGVTPYVTVDNQKAAVNQAHWYDPEVNPAFVDFANHWGFAVIPARPFRPRDKGGNESGIGVIQKQFYQEVRDRTFFSLNELNRVFREYLERLNTAVMKDWGVSRRDRFAGEQGLLKPCPPSNWEVAEWRLAKVHADCHVQVLKKFYSCPFKYVGREVRVKVTAKLIEVFDQDLNPLAAHARLLGKEIYSTDPKHYPEEKVALTQFSVQLAKRAAEQIGPETIKLVEELLGGNYPLKYLRRVQGILRLEQTGRITRAALEHAAKMAMTYRKLQFAYVQSTAEYFDKNGNRPSAVRSAPMREENSMYLHNNPSPKEEK
ncbi:MAG: IS21 family transposase [Bdellovibrionaceae bacterium]|nr:IS21 family transposase [Pseudobdellovibrionaceae bacterium]